MKIALGTVQFGMSYGIANQNGQVATPSVRAMLKLASTMGIDTLDTSIAYNDSEVVLGKVGTQEFRIVTKLPLVPSDVDNADQWITKQITESLFRLKVKSVDGLLLHNPNQLLEHNGQELFKSLQKLKDSGKVKKIGISIYSPCELAELTSRYHFEIVQAPFSLIDRRLHTSGWLQRLKEKGVEIHTRSIFLQGLLLMPRKSIPLKFAAWSGLWDKWHEWLKFQDVSALQACLAYPLSFPEVDRTIVGVDSLKQLEQIFNSIENVNISGLPDILCDDEQLINPKNWLN